MGLSLLNVIWIHGPPKHHGLRSHCPPPALRSRRPWPTLIKRVFASAVASLKKNKNLKPGETTFILFHLFFMRQLHQLRQDSCLLSLNLCNLLQFAEMKTFRFASLPKKLVPPFFVSGCAGACGTTFAE